MSDPDRQAVPDPRHGDVRFDRGGRFDAEGRPMRPLDDLLTARHMLARGWGTEDVVHVLGYLPHDHVPHDAGEPSDDERSFSGAP